MFINNQYQKHEAPIRVCAEIQGGSPHRQMSRSHVGAGRRSRGAFVTSVSHHSPTHGGTERQRVECLSAHLPTHQSPCSRRFSYACHAPKGLGRGAPEGEKGMRTTSVCSGKVAHLLTTPELLQPLLSQRMPCPERIRPRRPRKGQGMQTTSVCSGVGRSSCPR